MGPPRRDAVAPAEQHRILGPPARRAVLWTVAVVAVAILAWWMFWTPGGTPPDSEGWVEVQAITDVHRHNHLHGIGYDAVRERLYLATHFGLFIHEAGSLHHVAPGMDDYMGFTLHPDDGDTMHASGHPQRGGNMGVVRSTDGGATWTQVFTGVGRETVDFHSMATSRADPDVLAGWFQGRLYVSEDGGNAWRADHEVAGGPCWVAPCLAGDPHHRGTLYAGSMEGLLVSRDLGASWSVLRDGAHAGVLAHPVGGVLYAYSLEEGLVASQDGGDSWEARSAPALPPDSYLFQMEAHPDREGVLLAAAVDGSVHRSEDGGASWSRVVG